MKKKKQGQDKTTNIAKQADERVQVDLWSLPEGEGGLLHLHAHQEGVLGELHRGDEIQSCLCLKTRLHPRARKVCIHGHIAGHHQCSPLKQ